MLKLRAGAKINLTLDILGKRPDGYHEIASVLQAIDLADKLALREAETLSFVCNVSAISDNENLVMKAALLLIEETGCVRGAQLRLTKGIPLAAGLGGGSSDAAATLRGLNLLWELGLSRDDLRRIAPRLGSDVPFFLYGGAALVEGRGEIVTPLPHSRESWVVLLRPPLEVPHKTARLYGCLQPADFTTGEATQKLVGVLREGGRLEMSLLSNGFDRAAFGVFPGLLSFKQRFLAAGAPQVNLTGSGPTLFSLFADKAPAEVVYENLRRQGMKAYLVRTIGPEDNDLG